VAPPAFLRALRKASRIVGLLFEDLVAQGGLGMRTLALRGASPLEGGIPLIADGKIIGGHPRLRRVTSVQDGQVAKAGADVAK